MCWERLESAKLSSSREFSSWLTERDRDELSRWRAPRRRQDWLLGRFVAKKALIQWLKKSPLTVQRDPGMPLIPEMPRIAGISQIPEMHDIQILSRSPDSSKGIAPQVTIGQTPLSAGFSLSHADDVIAVAFSPNPDCQLGIDLVSSRPLSGSFLRSWYTDSEQQALIDGDELEPLRYWAAKEAAFKAFPPGPFEPRAIQLTPRPPRPRDANQHQRHQELQKLQELPEFLEFLAETTRGTQNLSAPVVVARQPIGSMTWSLAWYTWGNGSDWSQDASRSPFAEIKMESIGF
jgi:hypothetical protein